MFGNFAAFGSIYNSIICHFIRFTHRLCHCGKVDRNEIELNGMECYKLTKELFTRIEYSASRLLSLSLQSIRLLLPFSSFLFIQLILNIHIKFHQATQARKKSFVYISYAIITLTYILERKLFNPHATSPNGNVEK